ncbi:MAG: alfa-L-rhamnosidase, partial [Lachnospiraceae bacterium]|nr:alfa-L-rhamnosidase [Lachnospiraceae bacterium]
TTIWEHWDGIMPDGSFWSPDMNSFNHYAYGSVCDWIYEKACGIQLCEDAPGFDKVTIAPQPDDRLDYMEASIETLRGTVSSRWEKEDGRIRYTIEVPVEAEAVIDGDTCTLQPGRHVLYGKA